MDKRLTYALFGPDEDPIPYPARRRFQLAADMLSNHFTWTSESLVIEFESYRPSTYAALLPDPWQALLGDGDIRVDDAGWNALLVTRYLQWVSTEILNCTVRVVEEDDHVMSRFAVIYKGDISVYLTHRLRKCSIAMGKRRMDFMEAVARACNDDFFRAIPAVDYADRTEIAALGLEPEALAKLTLDDIADKLTFPWQTEWLTSPNKF